MLNARSSNNNNIINISNVVTQFKAIRIKLNRKISLLLIFNMVIIAVSEMAVYIWVFITTLLIDHHFPPIKKKIIFY